MAKIKHKSKSKALTSEDHADQINNATARLLQQIRRGVEKINRIVGRDAVDEIKSALEPEVVTTLTTLAQLVTDTTDDALTSDLS